jgi:hypothetical protein
MQPSVEFLDPVPTPPPHPSPDPMRAGAGGHGWSGRVVGTKFENLAEGYIDKYRLFQRSFTIAALLFMRTP